MASDQLPGLVHTYQNHLIDSTRWNYYTPRENDVIVATSYKSGTTWMQNIVLQLIFLGQPAPTVFEASPWIGGRFNPIDEIIDELEAQQHRRCIKTHLALDGLLFYPQLKYIVVGRSPRDVFMSLWNHYSNHTEAYMTRINNIPGRVGDPFPPCPQDIHEFWRNWISRGWFEWESEGYPYWGNMHHTRTWWNYRGLDNILFVHFNDLLTDLEGEIGRVAAFLEIEVSAESITTVAQAVSFSTMKQRAIKVGAFGRKILREGAQTFFFKGTNDRWKGILSEDELAQYEETIAKVLTPDCARWLEQGRAALP
jgi:aryl sulfotransferase